MIKKYGWVLIFSGLILICFTTVIYLQICPPREGALIYSILNGFSGNIIGEIIGGFLFLILALHLDRSTNEKIDEIVLLTKESEKLITRREKLLEMEQKIFRFKEFINKESYHNIRFFDCESKAPSPEGLEYAIYPVKNPDTKLPLKKETEMSSRYVVRITLPTYLRLLNQEEQQKYLNSPIHHNEYYFCSFYNGDWHLENEELEGNSYKFYFSSKIGPVEIGENANSFVNKYLNFTSNKELVTTVQLNDDGTICEEGTTYASYYIYKNDKNDLFVQIFDSPLKKMFNVDKKGEILFYIEDIIGYTNNPEKIKNIKKSILNVLKTKGITILQFDYRAFEDKFFYV